jgi:hypothetical protein
LLKSVCTTAASVVFLAKVFVFILNWSDKKILDEAMVACILLRREFGSNITITFEAMAYVEGPSSTHAVLVRSHDCERITASASVGLASTMTRRTSKSSVGPIPPAAQHTFKLCNRNVILACRRHQHHIHRKLLQHFSYS